MSRRKLLAAALVAPSAGGCGEKQLAPNSDRKSIVLITVATTRADHLGCYGRVLRGLRKISAILHSR